jgi:hypothetical protein
VLLEEDDVEPGGQAICRVAIVRPYLDRINAIDIIIVFDVPGRAEDDMDPSPVGHPARPRRSPAEVFVGVLYPFVMLIPKLILGRARGRVSVLPEGFDKNIPFLVCLELPEDISFLGSYDIDDFLIQPEAVGLGHLRPGLWLRGQDRRKQASDNDIKSDSLNHLHQILI